MSGPGRLFAELDRDSCVKIYGSYLNYWYSSTELLLALMSLILPSFVKRVLLCVSGCCLFSHRQIVDLPSSFHVYWRKGRVNCAFVSWWWYLESITRVFFGFNCSFLRTLISIVALRCAWGLRLSLISWNSLPKWFVLALLCFLQLIYKDSISSSSSSSSSAIMLNSLAEVWKTNS